MNAWSLSLHFQGRFQRETLLKTPADSISILPFVLHLSILIFNEVKAQRTTIQQNCCSIKKTSICQLQLITLSIAKYFVTYMSFLANRAARETDATKSDRVTDIRPKATAGTSIAQVLHTTNPAQISPNPLEVPRTKGGNSLVPHKERSKDQRYQRSSRKYQQQKISDPTTARWP